VARINSHSRTTQDAAHVSFTGFLGLRSVTAGHGHAYGLGQDSNYFGDRFFAFDEWRNGTIINYIFSYSPPVTGFSSILIHGTQITVGTDASGQEEVWLVDADQLLWHLDNGAWTYTHYV
jgi:hypothetical protein